MKLRNIIILCILFISTNSMSLFGFFEKSAPKCEDSEVKKTMLYLVEEHLLTAENAAKNSLEVYSFWISGDKAELLKESIQMAMGESYEPVKTPGRLEASRIKTNSKDDELEQTLCTINFHDPITGWGYQVQFDVWKDAEGDTFVDIRYKE